VIRAFKAVAKWIRGGSIAVRRGLWVARVKRSVASHEGNIHCGGPTILTANTHLKHHVHFSGMRIYGDGHVEIGAHFHSGRDCVLITGNHNYDSGELIPYDKTIVEKDIVIDDCVWLGMRVTVLGGVHLGEGAVVQAGSVVVNDIPKYAVAGGSPARVFKYRDIEHYEQLKAAGKFY